MSPNPASYDVHPILAEAYDLHETHTTDVELIRRLIGDRKGLRILEPFCGTGRILLPLACDGHEVVGIDISGHMLQRVRRQGGATAARGPVADHAVSGRRRRRRLARRL